MFDYLIKGGTIVDGTGRPGFIADVGITDGKIVAVEAATTGDAHQVLDATGLMVSPGFVDPHTHFDAQLLWDPTASPSTAHGVTSVIGGNCGFTLAPLRGGDADYIRRMMSRVEGMPLAALESGSSWAWESFGDYLAELDGHIGVNAGFLVGHCALRRYVMGDDAVRREATDAEIEAMKVLLRQSIEAGGIGFSTTRSSSHSDGDGNPVASRLASTEEVLALCAVVGEFEGTVLEAITEGCTRRFEPDEVELLVEMSAAAGRPLNWNVLIAASNDEELAFHQLEPSRRAREIGGRVVALTMPVHAQMNMSMNTFCGLWLIPGWEEIMVLPAEEKASMLRDPATQARMLASAVGTPQFPLTDFASYEIGETSRPENRHLEGRRVSDIADETGQAAFNRLIEIVINDDYKTVLWPAPSADAESDWALRQVLWNEPDVLIGGSDAGAHLDRILGSPYPAKFLADCIRGRKLVSVERAVQLMTDIPARLFGLRDRGRVEVGYFADVVVFDPTTIDSGRAKRIYDMPAASMRLTADSTGLVRVLVNGVETVVDSVPTGARAGTLMRAGRDTTTVATR